jgi:hypothetical protein
VLKPTRASANLGVKLIQSRLLLEREFEDALARCRMNNLLSDYTPLRVAEQWLLTEYVDGAEFEAHVYVVEGQRVFTCIHEKIVASVGCDLFELGVVTPVRFASRAVRDSVRQFLDALAQQIYMHVAQPSGFKAFVFYPEFRVRRSDSVCVCLEFAFRPGGTVTTVTRSTGIDFNQLAAKVVLHRGPASVAPPHKPRGVCMRVVYSTVRGIFVKIEGFKHAKGVSMEPRVNSGHAIEIPKADHLAFIHAEAETPRKAKILAEHTIESLSVVIKTAPVGAQKTGTLRGKQPSPD